MAKLVWDKTDERLYQNGVDHGLLSLPMTYVPDGSLFGFDAYSRTFTSEVLEQLRPALDAAHVPYWEDPTPIAGRTVLYFPRLPVYVSVPLLWVCAEGTADDPRYILNRVVKRETAYEQAIATSLGNTITGSTGWSVAPKLAGIYQIWLVDNATGETLDAETCTTLFGSNHVMISYQQSYPADLTPWPEYQILTDVASIQFTAGDTVDQQFLGQPNDNLTAHCLRSGSLIAIPHGPFDTPNAAFTTEIGAMVFVSQLPAGKALADYSVRLEKLYFNRGYIWNGLTSVTLTGEGGDANDIYADNIKYGSLRGQETLNGTIEAYTYPDEFGYCDGSEHPKKGVCVGQQPHREFDFAFRSQTGNAAGDTTDRLHFVYGATASPSERAYETINDSPDAITFSWEVTTVGKTIEGYRPISGIDIDLSKADSESVQTLKNWVEGDGDCPRVLIFEGERNNRVPQAFPTTNANGKFPDTYFATNASGYAELDLGGFLPTPEQLLSLFTTQPDTEVETP